MSTLTRQDENKTPPPLPNLLFPEYDLVNDEEVLVNTVEDDKIAEAVAQTTIWDDASEPEGEDDEDAKLNQADYSKALGNEVVDPMYVRFLTRVRKGGEKQVLRYCRWQNEASGGGPLYLHSSTAKITAGDRQLPVRISQDDVPLCQACGTKREFEFQVI
jgi:hypothetical protein